MVSTVSLVKPFRRLGGFVGMALDTFVCMFQRPFAWREYLLQTWFVARVSLVPTLMLSIPFTVLTVFSSRPWVYRAPCHRAGPGIRTATTIGSSPTGWTPPAPKRRCISRTTRGPNCGPNCRRSTDCCATRARSSPGLCEWSWRAGRRIGTHPVSTPTRGGKYVPNWASRYGIGPKRFQRRRFHARPTAVTRADQNCIW